MRRSIRLGPGVKINLNKRSVGLTVGGRGAHYSVNTAGQHTTTVGLPGTGISYINRTGRTRRARTQPAVESAIYAPAPGPSHPGVFARHYERAFAHGVQQFLAGQHEQALESFGDAARSDDKDRAIADDLFVGILSAQLGHTQEAIPALEKVVAHPEALPDILMTKYADGLRINLQVGELMAFPVELGSVAAVMVLATCYREAGRLDEAIGLMQQLDDHTRDPAILIPLCDMYKSAGDWEEIIHATAGIANDDDASLLLRIIQAEAMEHQGMDEAAIEVYRDTLRSRKRDTTLLKEARYSRAKLYLKLGKTSQAKRDLNHLYAEDPEFNDVAEVLQSLS
jgi:tetratricopeptide (TPR) repeat protein